MIKETETVVEIQNAIKEIERVEKKLINNEQLSLEEVNFLGLHLSLERDVLDLDEVFRPFKQKEIYLQYNNDLSFKQAPYYKKNRNKKISDYLSYDYLKSLNKEKFDQKRHDNLVKYLIDNEVLIPKSIEEVAKDKMYLEDIAYWWGEQCAKENHKDIELYQIAIETRDKEVLGLKNIKEYLLGNNDIETFKGLMKSYYSYNEAVLLYNSIKREKGETAFDFNGQTINYTIISIFHIFYRHYAQIVSPELISKKTFFTPEISPDKIHILLGDLFSKIKQNKLFASNIVGKQNMMIFFRYKDVYYSVAFGISKHVKSSTLIIKSFFPLDENHEEGKKMLNRIKDNNSYKSNFLGDGLTVYTPLTV